MELPAVLTMAGFAAAALLTRESVKLDHAALLGLCLWEAHYLYRTFIYPARMQGAPRPMPLAIVLSGAMFNVVNGSFNGWWLFGRQDAGADPHVALSLVGTLVFLAGFATHISSDNILLNLRKPGESGYKIPHGGLYRWLSCPNYFGEILQWMGFALLTQSMAALGFVVWTIANLLPRALANHRWYQQKFPEYPRSRRAIVPFLL